MLRRVAMLLPIVLNPGWREFFEHFFKIQFPISTTDLDFPFVTDDFEIVCFIVQIMKLALKFYTMR